MKVTTNTVYDILIRMRDYFELDNPAKKYTHEEPLRASLLSSDQMEEQGKLVASTHKLTDTQGPDQLLKRLADNEKVLLEVRNLLADTIKTSKRITPAGEWLLDNFYLIEEQITIAKKHLPKGYSLSLPRLGNDGSVGLPRVYDIALEIISHSDGRVDLRSLSNFVAAYQTITTLTMGELWAIPIMLRLALIENLRRVAARIALDKIDQNLANYWAERMMEAVENKPKDLILEIADMARSNPPLESPFVAELTRRIQGKGPALAMVMTWLEQQLSDTGVTTNELVNFENQKQAADQVSMSNSIGSLRFLGATDWREFVETLSTVEQVLRADEAGVYGQMDFYTRDNYRHVVEAISRKSDHSETAIAELVARLAKEQAEVHGKNDRRAHLGYFLVDKGLHTTQKEAGMRFTRLEKLKRGIGKLPVSTFLWSIAVITVICTVGMMYLAKMHELPLYLMIALAVVTALGTSQLAVSVVNWMTTIMVLPKLLPRMDYSKGIASESKALVAIPTMISSPASVESLTETLEVRYLGNIDDNLSFALLTDFPDADAEVMPDDSKLIHLASEKIGELNEKYRKGEKDIFFLFHRPRKWNPKEGSWMGEERKRGKLADLNAFLKGHGAEKFSVIIGDTSHLNDVKYVITLDTDTELPRETAWRMAGAMAHPLNRPVYDEKKQRVVEGYGILQPRAAISLPKTDASAYTKMHGNDTGLDPYTRVTSDVYQDLFSEGSFIGKGIYEIDAFEKALDNRFPDNRILSHDLLEGCYVRSGLLSDVQLYEEYPSSYMADVKRRHRWIRGDWQIGSWMFPLVPGVSNKLHKNRLSALSVWKIFDNLRRSLVPAALTVLFVAGWIMLPYSWLWTVAVLCILLLPTLIGAAWHALHKPEDLGLDMHIKDFKRGLKDNLAHFAFNVAILPYEAWYSLDAILRTIWRMVVSKRKLLEWTPSNAQKVDDKSLTTSFKSMWIAPTLSLICFCYLAYYTPLQLIAAAPILILWFAAPAIAWRISQPAEKRKSELSEQQRIFLLKLTRKTWAFFETFVTKEDNWLPPDNYQEQPAVVTAHRTSPTNIGLALLANLTAWDFGYLSLRQLVARTGNTLETMSRLERHHGHFLNWYDTVSLQPLPPRYISAVDSGNLAGHLLTLRQGLYGACRQKVISNRVAEGLRDTWMVLVDEIKGEDSADLIEAGRILVQAVHAEPMNPGKIRRLIEQLMPLAEKITESTKQGVDDPVMGAWWAEAFRNQLSKVSEDLDYFIPWINDKEVPEELAELLFADNVPELQQIASLSGTIKDYAASHTDISGAANAWLENNQNAIEQASQRAQAEMDKLFALAGETAAFADMEYGFLYDRSKHLLRIGFNVDEQRNDASFYDLLASEARLGTFVAISQGKLPQESWFALGRLLTSAGGDPILLSWSGSMFEYLMPLLVMPEYENTLLHQTNQACVARQIEYGRQRGVPWGISESAYNTVDANLNYQYRAFGVPGLGLKRGLGDDLVIAPYATVMALMVAPEEATANLQQLSAEGFEGSYGLYEAVDYTQSRVPRGKENVLIRSFMVHHQGMGLLSLAYLLLDKPMQKRFEAEPQFQASLLLLQEKIPRATIFQAHTADLAETHIDTTDPEMRVINSPNTPVPEVQLLSNGKYQVMVTNSGGGYSLWKNIAITRWREDSTRDNWGAFCYIKDIDTGKFWSNTYHPTLVQAQRYEAVFSQGHAEYSRKDDGFDTRTEVVVSPEDDMEIRRVRITNRSDGPRIIEITSYTEVVLNAAAADNSHPAFSNLFVQTEILQSQNAIICTRRPRSVHETPPWMFHLMTVIGGEIQSISYETDRSKFIGRGNSVLNPQALSKDGDMSGTDGSVLDPIVAIRYRVLLKKNQVAIADMVYGIGENREVCYNLLHKYQDRHLKNRAFELSWTHSQVLLRQINATESDAQLYGRLAGSILYSNPTLRADSSILRRNYRGQPALWAYSISGDLPIVLLRLQDSENIELARQMVQAHAYWKLKGLAVDLVIFNEDHGSYRQVLQDQILGLVSSTSAYATDKPGGVFVKSADQISNEDRILFQSIARIIITDEAGSLSEQVSRRAAAKPLPPAIAPTMTYTPEETIPLMEEEGLVFDNGKGGFSSDGKEYIIVTSHEDRTPAPWVNVIANPDFGTIVSESGSSYTWGVNAHEFRLTPWHNDPVSDQGGEAFYLRDEQTGSYWSPAPLPNRGKTPYKTRHGFGYTVFEHIEDGISSQMWTYVDMEASVKFIVIKLKNLSGLPRKLSATGYVEWVLGDRRPKTAMTVVTEIDNESGAIFARNRYNTPFAERICFLDVDEKNRSFTTDRQEFIGRNGSLRDPAAMKRTKLSNKAAGMDPCAAIQVYIDLAPESEHEIVFRLGTGRNAWETNHYLRLFKGISSAEEVLQNVQEFWSETLGAVQIQTPDNALNILANGWLTYQTISCRLWGRSGYYQSGGAFGFRDQLQDVISLMHAKPALTRAQILLCASRQFREGDVQHWWHPPTGRGVRTRCSDDYLWLPYATARYIEATGDKTILDESVYFLEGRLLNVEEESYYDLPTRNDVPASLYDHCVSAIRNGFQFGQHGLPLIGSGDWNDGMDMVGREGKGESTWLGFFLYDILNRFVPVADIKEDQVFAEECRQKAEALKNNLEQHGWDGNWYRRAYFDDGTPLGSSENEECSIDSISQSWAVLSGAGDKDRTQKAMQAVDQRLVRRDHGLIQLLDPPFDKSELNPGYIKGYVPGVRENGGQYTHAAIWTLMAFAALGENEKVWELFSMINPINHGNDAEKIAVYKAEPYVAAADIYAVSPHKGRGGWTWYTGSAGWMYQFIIEWLIGMRLEEDRLHFKPCIPNNWKSFKVTYQYKSSVYDIVVNTGENSKPGVILDGQLREDMALPLADDGTRHNVEIRIPQPVVSPNTQ